LIHVFYDNPMWVPSYEMITRKGNKQVIKGFWRERGTAGLPTKQGKWSRGLNKNKISPWPFDTLEQKFFYIVRRQKGLVLEFDQWLRLFHLYGMFYSQHRLKKVLVRMYPYGLRCCKKRIIMGQRAYQRTVYIYE